VDVTGVRPFNVCARDAESGYTGIAIDSTGHRRRENIVNNNIC